MKDKTSKNILITGHSGYLGTHILNSPLFEHNNFILFDGRVQDIDNWNKYNNIRIDYILHAGSPAGMPENVTEEYITYLKDSIIVGTKNAVSFATRNDIKLFCFSTYGIYFDNNPYEQFKKIAFDLYKNKSIMIIIPRIYSSDKNSGLIKKLKDNKIPEKDMDEFVSYTSIEEFLEILYHEITFCNSDSIKIPETRKSTIREIKKLFL